jgi:aminoglycoside phosphotransferase (APT) family kinase protein
MNRTTDLPDDAALPGIVAMRALGVTRALGLARALLALGLEDAPVSMHLVGYTPGARATLDVRVGQRRFAVKAYAEDPTPEAVLYQAIAAAGVSGDSPIRVPPLLAWDRDLRVMVIGWLEGPTAHELVKQGRGQRAGELAAQWLRGAASLPVRLGMPLGAARMLNRTPQWVAELREADPTLGDAATRLAANLAQTQPREHAPRLVHGTFYARHVLDLGDGPGVIDWERFGQGPLELDAGMFLATTWRLGLDHDALAGEATRAITAFLEGTRGLLDERALAWHRAAALLRLANKVHVVKRRKTDWLVRAHALLAEATRLAEHAPQPAPVARAKPRAFQFRGALELVLQALSTRPATPEELDQIRKLLDETDDRTS